MGIIPPIIGRLLIWTMSLIKPNNDFKNTTKKIEKNERIKIENKNKENGQGRYLTFPQKKIN